MLDSIAKAYIKSRFLLNEEFKKSIENGLIVATPENYVPGKHPKTAIESRDNLPYNPTKEMQEIRQNLQSEQHNPVLAAANRYTQSKFGRKLNVSPDNFVPASFRKQYIIGMAGKLAAQHHPEYEKSVFNDYAKNQPELVRESGATDYKSLVKGAYQKAASETQAQFDHLPLKLQFHPGHLNYNDSNEMMRDIMLHHNLTTYQGGERHEYLNAIHPKLGVTSNDILRAVHDGYSHGILGNPFGEKGEEVAYQIHSQMYSPLAKIAVAGETRQQNSLVNFTNRNLDVRNQMEGIRKERNHHIHNGDFDAANEASAKLRDVGGKWRYADQVSVALPPSMNDPKYNGEVPDYMRTLLKDPQTQHTDTYDVDKDHLDLVKLSKHHNTGSHQAADPKIRGIMNPENALSDLKHVASIHGFSKLSRNPFQ